MTTSTRSAPVELPIDPARRQRRRLALVLLLLGCVGVVAGLLVGSQGWSFDALQAAGSDTQMAVILTEIRLPRTLGALAVGALLGLAGAIAQGLFRNPLADPYLLGSAAGAGLGVVLALAAGAAGGHVIALASAGWVDRIGLVGAAFVGAVVGVTLTLLLARGATHTLRLLLAGVVVGVVMGAASDLIVTWSPEALRGRQSFLLGSTGFLSAQSVALLGMGLLIAVPVAYRLARALDALVLGDDSARSLGVDLRRVRLVLVLVLAGATGLAVSQAGLVAFVGLLAPHLVRRYAPCTHGYLLVASAGAGGVLLLAADVLARGLLAPEELPVGVLTALVGGAYLLWMLHRRAAPR